MYHEDNILKEESAEVNIPKDELTGCYSIAAFSNVFEKMIKDAEEKYLDVTLVMLDIDNFMNINDDFGHKTGDETLKAVVGVLQDIQIEKYVYRYSGDQFAILMPNAEKEQAFLIMEKIREQISGGFSIDYIPVKFTISIGIATYPEDGSRMADVIRKAEGALYRAKASGRNKVAIAKEEKLVTKTAHYSVEQLERLKELSKNMNLPEASLMREALDDLLNKYDKRNHNGALSQKDIDNMLNKLNL